MHRITIPAFCKQNCLKSGKTGIFQQLQQVTEIGLIYFNRTPCSL